MKPERLAPLNNSVVWYSLYQLGVLVENMGLRTQTSSTASDHNVSDRPLPLQLMNTELCLRQATHRLLVRRREDTSRSPSKQSFMRASAWFCLQEAQ
jgi:hypothetical protein